MTYQKAQQSIATRNRINRTNKTKKLSASEHSAHVHGNNSSIESIVARNNGVRMVGKMWQMQQELRIT